MRIKVFPLVTINKHKINSINKYPVVTLLLPLAIDNGSAIPSKGAATED